MAADAPAQRPTVWRLAIAETIIWAGAFYLFPALLPHWEADLGWSKTALSGAFTSALIASALAAPLAGRLIDHGHGRVMLATCMLAAALLLLMLTQVTALWQFYLLWLLLGLCMAGSLYESCFAFLVRLLGEHAKAAITRVTLVAGFAGTLSFPTSHWLTGQFGWRAAALFFALLIAAVAVPLAWSCSDAAADPDSASGTPSGDRPKPLGNPVFWLLGIGFALLMLNHGMLVTHLLPLLYERGVDAGLAVAVAATIGPMQVAGRLLMLFGGNLLAVTGFAALAFLLVSSAALTLTVAGTTAALIFLFAALQGSGHGLVSIVRPLVAAQLLGRTNFGAISGLLAVPFVGAMAIAPTLASLLWKAGGYPLMIQVCTLLPLLGLACFIAAARIGKQRHSG